MHESLKVHKNTYFEGDIRVKGQAPFIFQRYNVNNGSTATAFKLNDYEAAVVGFRALGGDIYEGGPTNPIQVYMYRNGDVWAIYCDFSSEGHHETWQVDIMFVSKRLTSRVGSSW